MGHAFQHTLMDALIRYHRMRGDRALWQMGTDHAGIATQMLVERQLNEQGQTRHDIGRAAFLERVWAWKRESGDNISHQLRRMGRVTDERASDAIDVLAERRLPDGTWGPSGYWWRPPGSGGASVEAADWGRGSPSPMLTLNALRVLKAAGRWSAAQS